MPGILCFPSKPGPNRRGGPAVRRLAVFLGGFCFFPAPPLPLTSIEMPGFVALLSFFFLGGGLGARVLACLGRIGLFGPEFAGSTRRAQKKRAVGAFFHAPSSQGANRSRRTSPPARPHALSVKGEGLRRRQSAASGLGRAEALKRLAIPTNSTNSERNPSLSAPTEPFANRSTSSHVIVPVMFPPRSSWP